MIVYVKNPKISTKLFLEIITEVSRVAGPKFSVRLSEKCNLKMLYSLRFYLYNVLEMTKL